ncbi:hypothetical protein GOODEAATRI_026818 [Goodea atripinnis]|uniref:Aldehyde dehydrogenase domain-containing protein n=1 Tax=Goodea atripinnis TaxID=208336 RepID=A0ABV0NDZ3_9TELE
MRTHWCQTFSPELTALVLLLSAEVNRGSTDFPFLHRIFFFCLSLNCKIMSSPPSPSSNRWFKALRRTRLGEPCLRTYPLECVDLLRRARIAFQAGRTLKEGFRLAQLEAVVRMLEEHECDFVDALGRDLHKPRFETVVFELITVKNEALHAISNLKKWMEPHLDECLVISEPLGVVFIMGTWCSPVQMCLVPLVGAIAAGAQRFCNHTRSYGESHNR